MEIKPADYWVAKLNGYNAPARELLLERCITDVQAEVIEVIANLLREAADDEFNAGRDTDALRGIEEQVRQLTPAPLKGPGW